MSSQPLLGHNSGHSSQRKKDSSNQRSSAFLFLNILTGGLVAPSATTYDSMEIILNTEDPEERDELTRTWRNHKLEELNFVGVVGGLLSGCLTSTGAWPNVMANGQDKPWSVKAFWYSGIIFAVFAVLTAAQQGLRLHRLSGHRDGLELIRSIMTAAQDGDNTAPDGDGGRVRVRPRKMQVYAWQASLAFLVGAVVCLIAGITVLVWTAAAWGPKKQPEDGFWDSNALLALVFTIVIGLSTFVFIAVQTSLATGVRDES
ncbi:Uu.00g050670.m01.CDS01 [Anthostomella pinea]|uniref:Uu.00g050670.m01.CDS01 n=1 Tax=Anthostomella pinea TaxID=933095 RepID=A0AAI8VTJ0_9PEZI|nr:Uu.00g050670.m01.CDS01 [Anthostomella pinea]